MLHITDTLALREDELEESFIRASGPGGQNVNKVASAVQLRFDAARSSSLPEEVRQRLVSLAGSQMSNDGVITIKAMRYRTQEQNRIDARTRLIALLRAAAVRPTLRYATRPTRGSQQRRVDDKRERSATKRLRRAPYDE